VPLKRGLGFLYVPIGLKLSEHRRKLCSRNRTIRSQILGSGIDRGSQGFALPPSVASAMVESSAGSVCAHCHLQTPATLTGIGRLVLRKAFALSSEAGRQFHWHRIQP
jgi:hypothetical protein